MPNEQFRNHALVSEDADERNASHDVNEGVPEGNTRVESIFEPQAKPIEAPGGSPANQRPEDQPVENRTRRPEACSVVVPRKESDAVPGRDVLPVATTLTDDGQWCA